MLEVALGPSSVARGEVDQRGGAFLEAAAERREHVDRPTSPAHQRRLHEIMAQDMTAERRPPRQIGHPAMIGERACANDRVVAPIIAVAPHPERQAGGDDGAGDARCELLYAREQGVAIDDQRQALNDSGVRIGFHRRREPDDRIRGHQAVGVQDDHLGVGGAPARDEVGDIARLAAHVLSSSAIEQTRRRKSLAHRQQRPLLGDPDVGIGGVGEKEIVEGIAQARRLDVLINRLHRREHTRRGLVVDRHDDRGLDIERARQRVRTRRAKDEPGEAQHALREGEADPGERQHEQRDQRPFQWRDHADLDDAVHFPLAIDRQRKRAAEHEQPLQPRRPRAIRIRPGAPLGARELAQRLHRHRERRLARHRRRRRFRDRGRGGNDFRRRCGQAVHRYSQVSLTGLLAAFRTNRISERVSDPGSRSNTTRMEWRSL